MNEFLTTQTSDTYFQRPLTTNGRCLMENPKYLTNQILTYLGNKRSLLNFIDDSITTVKNRLGQGKLSFFDAFSGSGIVSRFMKRHASLIIANDLEQYSEIVNHCFLTNACTIDADEFEHYFQKWVAYTHNHPTPGVITKLYAPRDDHHIQQGERVFYTHENALIIDSARNALDRTIPQKYFDLLLAPLLAEASIHSNTSGVFKGFYKARTGIGAFGGEGKNAIPRICGRVQLQKPLLSQFNCDSIVLREDANTVVNTIREVDLAYFDPPYNQHPYGSNYFMLNLIANNTEPQEISRVSGIPRNWNHSKYNKKSSAEESLFSLLENTPAKFLLISYNSEGFIKREHFISFLKTLGKLTPVDIEYNTFRGSRNLRDRSLKVTEYLFLVERD